MCSSAVIVKIIVIALIAIGAIIRDVDAKRYRRIINGKDAGADEFPWMARLNLTAANGVNYDCGGAIISSRHILTAANCLEGSTLNSIWTGSNVRDYNVALKSSPAKIILHPRYNRSVIYGSTYIYNDVGIVVLNKDLQLGIKRDVIPLTDHETATGTYAVLSGWGFIDKSKKHQALVLQKMPIAILPTSYCPAITTKQLCGASISEAIPNYNDAGSALVADDRIVGILSSAFRVPGGESIYTDVYYHHNWIISTCMKYI